MYMFSMYIDFIHKTNSDELAFFILTAPISNSETIGKFSFVKK